MFNYKNKENIFIIGCSSVGSYIGNELSSRGHNVTIIDKNDSAFKLLPESFSGFKTIGNGTDFDFLNKQGIRQASIVLITTDDDNINSYIAQYLKLILNLPIVITRIYDEKKSIVLENSGVKIIYTTQVMAKEFFNKLSDSIVENENNKEIKE